MRVRYLAVAALACSLSLLLMPQPIEPAEPQKTVAQVDFDILHAQASAALETLSSRSNAGWRLRLTRCFERRSLFVLPAADRDRENDHVL
jgi:hypothetical protein